MKRTIAIRLADNDSGGVDMVVDIDPPFKAEELIAALEALPIGK